MISLPRNIRRSLCIAGLGAITLSAIAAPATSEELNNSTERDSATASRTGSPAAAVPAPVTATVPQSKTVELLLQMQDQPGLLTGDAKDGKGSDAARRSSNVTGKAAASKEAEPESNPLANLKATILGTPNPSSNQSAVQERERIEGDATRRSTSGGGGNFGQAPTSGEPRESLLSNPVIRFIRENRTLVVGVSLAVLIAIWATASFSMRRSR